LVVPRSIPTARAITGSFLIVELLVLHYAE
jgi:hypothetical protein